MAKKFKITPYDTADYLKTEADIEGYMHEVLKADDPALLAYALGVVARVRGMSKVAKKSGLSRESLYKALSGEGNPKLETIFHVIRALGLKMSLSATSSR